MTACGTAWVWALTFSSIQFSILPVRRLRFEFFTKTHYGVQHTTTSNIEWTINIKHKKVFQEFNGHVLNRLTNNKIQLYRFGEKRRTKKTHEIRMRMHLKSRKKPHSLNFIFNNKFTIAGSTTATKNKSVWLDIRLETNGGAQLSLSVALWITNAAINECKRKPNTIQFSMISKKFNEGAHSFPFELIPFIWKNLWSGIVLCARNYGCQWCIEWIQWNNQNRVTAIPDHSIQCDFWISLVKCR